MEGPPYLDYSSGRIFYMTKNSNDMTEDDTNGILLSIHRESAIIVNIFAIR